jgi:zinc protease
MARTFGAALAVGDTVADVLAWPDRIEAVSAEEVRAAAAAVLRLDLAVTGQLLPA